MAATYGLFNLKYFFVVYREKYPNDLQYQHKRLSISSENPAAFWAVNELLKKPIVDFKSYTLDELESNFDEIISGD